MSFLTKKPRHGNIVANSDVLAIMTDNDIFNDISLEMKYKLKDDFLQLLIMRLDKMNDGKFVKTVFSCKDAENAKKNILMIR